MLSSARKEAYHEIIREEEKTRKMQTNFSRVLQRFQVTRNPYRSRILKSHVGCRPSFTQVGYQYLVKRRGEKNNLVRAGVKM